MTETPLSSVASFPSSSAENRESSIREDRTTVLYLCTTFPQLSETFVEREIQYLATKCDLQIISLWRGGTSPGLEVRPIPVAHLFRLLYLLPLWLLRKPSALIRLLQSFFIRFPRAFLNLQETLLGMGMGVLLAEEIRKNPPAWIHGIWATAPATTAWTIHLLTGAPFSFGAHAYDLFQAKGDCLLAEKIQAASWVRTTTQAGLSELVKRGASPDRAHLIHRGLAELPERSYPRPPEGTLRLLTVGRLVPKKGFTDFVRLCRILRDRGIDFTATLIGEGPQRNELESLIHSSGLSADQMLLTGSLPAESVYSQFKNADLFLFTGVVSQDGDRDGLPNVVPEAMAHGIPVLAREAPGVLEAISDGETGTVLSGFDLNRWAGQILELWADLGKREKFSENGRKWVEENFLSETNTALLKDRILASANNVGKEKD